jgi:hypothetical protein
MEENSNDGTRRNIIWQWLPDNISEAAVCGHILGKKKGPKGPLLYIASYGLFFFFLIHHHFTVFFIIVLSFLFIVHIDFIIWDIIRVLLFNVFRGLLWGRWLLLLFVVLSHIK